jgi:hypothetical protein
MNTQKFYKLLKLLFYPLITPIFIVQFSYGASLDLQWDANIEGYLVGYRVYYGNSSGNYEEHVDVGNVTEYELSGLNEEETYYITLTAYDTFNNESEKSNEISAVAQLPPDTQDPAIIITFPTSSATYATGSGTIAIGGTASDNLAVTQVTWSNNRGGSGTASGTVNWSVSGVTLQEGNNIVTVTVWDAAGNTGTDTTSVNYTQPSTSSISTSIPTTTTTVVLTTTTTAAVTTTTPITTTVPVTTTTPSTTTTPVTTTVPVTTTAPATTTVPVTTTAPVTTTIPSDANPPEGSITINNGHKNTESPYVTLSLFASKKDKELDGDALMMLSNNNKKWSDPEPYTTTKNWTLSSGKRTKTVYVKFRDAAGNWMTAPAQDQITLLNSKRKLQPTSIASSSELPPLWVKDKAIDEDFVTSWSTFLILFWQNEYFTLDLGKVMMLDRVDMYATRFFDRNLFPVDFTIEISKDMHTWEPLCTERGYTIKPDYSDSWDINCYQGRYIRINITKAKTFFFFFHLAQIAEVEVYGYDLTEQQPTERPVTTPSINTWNPAKEGQEETGEEPPIVAEILPIKPGIPGIPVITLN